MPARRVLLAFGVASLMTFYAFDANAANARTCFQVAWELVGKPLSKSVIEELGKELGRTLINSITSRYRDQDQVTLSQSDVNELFREAQARGMSDCELRQQLETAVNAPQYPNPGDSSRDFANRDSSRDFIIHNNTSLSIIDVRVSASFDQSWEHNVLIRVVPPYTSTRININDHPGNCGYHLRVTYSGGQQQAFPINVCMATNFYLPNGSWD